MARLKEKEHQIDSCISWVITLVNEVIAVTWLWFEKQQEIEINEGPW